MLEEREMTDVESNRAVVQEKEGEASREKNVKVRRTSPPANEPSPQPRPVSEAVTLEPPDEFAMLSQR